MGKYFTALYNEHRGRYDHVPEDDKYYFLKDNVTISGKWYDAGAGTNVLRDMLSKQFNVTPLTLEIDLDEESLPFEDNSIDVVTNFELIEHVLNPLFMMKETRRVMKPGAKLYMTTPDIYCSFYKAEHIFQRKNREHFHEFMKSDLAWLLERAGFTNFQLVPFRRIARSSILKLKLMRLFVDATK